MKYIGVRICLLSAIVLLSACSTIKSWFPDKERDYQFRSEIAPLVIPEDLKAKSSPTLPVARSPQQIAHDAVMAASNDNKNVQNANSSPQSDSAKSQAISATHADTNTSKTSSSIASSLVIDQGREQAWRMVGKALTQQRFEIVERNLEQGHFYIRFNPSDNNSIYTSIWDEFKFLFVDELNNEQEYRLKLTEISALSTEVTVQDGQGKVLSNAIANQILKLITDGINGNNATDAAQENKPITTQ